MSAAGAVAGDVGVWVLILFVLLGVVPLATSTYQYLLIGLHGWHDHYPLCAPYLPRVAVLVPAWNEALVIAATIDRLMTLDYPVGRLRVYVVDDASTDETPDIVIAKGVEYDGLVVHLRREKGGEGKAHTLNHGLRVILAEDWMEALLIIDADVIYQRDSLRRLTRHLADPKVGAVTANIKEGSLPGNYLTRFIAYEYTTAQGAGRRAQNVMGAVACLAGGAQLHSRANLVTLGGQIDTSSLAEDTFTTINTQLAGNKVVYEPNAVVWAEEPVTIDGLWKQRLRWARGNVQVTWQYRRLWFRPSPVHRLGSVAFGLLWFSIFLLPVFMILASLGLLSLYFIDSAVAWRTFHTLWIANALNFVLVTAFTLLLEPTVARRSWVEAVCFPGVISLGLIVYSCFTRVSHYAFVSATDAVGVSRHGALRTSVVLFSYSWLAGSMAVAWLAKRLEKTSVGRWATPSLLYLVGYGPLLCAVTFTSYVREFRHAEMTWDKTEKTGTVSTR